MKLNYLIALCFFFFISNAHLIGLLIVLKAKKKQLYLRKYFKIMTQKIMDLFLQINYIR